jgi:hypothetical protein
LDETSTKITSIQEATRTIVADTNKLQNDINGLSGDTAAFSKAATNDLIKVTGLVRGTETLCAEISADVLRVNQAEARLQQLIP